MGFIASRRHSGGLGVGMWVHVSHGDGITAAKRLWYCLTKRAYSQFPARSRPTPRTCTRTPEAAQETRAGRHVMYVGDLEPDCCIASRPRVAAFLLRQLQAAWRLAACSGGSKDKALVKPNMALYHKRWGPTNRPIKGSCPHLPTISPASRASPVAPSQQSVVNALAAALL
jgi:hypothetical protein